MTVHGWLIMTRGSHRLSKYPEAPLFYFLEEAATKVS